MRWLFLFVFSLNLAYIGLEMSKSSSSDYADVPALKNVQTIVLLSELKQLQTEPAKVEQVEEKVEAVTIDDVSTENLPVKQEGSEHADVEQAGSGRSVAKPQEVVEKEPEPEIVSAPVKSSDEKNVTAETVVSDRQVKPVETPPVKTSQSARCFTLGPFRDLDKLRGLTREIKSYVVEADFRGREEKEQTLYWVYVKPEKNRKQAIKTGKRLKAKKIKDFYVIRDGKKINGLSLGHFRSKKGAYSLAKKVKNLGFDVIVEPVFRTYTIYWLDYQLVGGVNIPESIFEKYVKPGKKEKISRLSRECNG